MSSLFCKCIKDFNVKQVSPKIVNIESVRRTPVTISVHTRLELYGDNYPSDVRQEYAAIDNTYITMPIENVLNKSFVLKDLMCRDCSGNYHLLSVEQIMNFCKIAEYSCDIFNDMSIYLQAIKQSRS